MIRPLNIGITCHATFGGSGIVATELGMSLAQRGHRVHFICAHVPPRLEVDAENISFHEVSAPPYPLFQDGQYALALASKMVEVSTNAALDLLHVHYAIPHATSAYLARQILAGRGPKVVTTLHGTDAMSLGINPSFFSVTRFSAVQSDGLTVPSQFLKSTVYENFQLPRTVPIEVIPNFVDTDRFAPSSQRGWDRLRSLFRTSGVWGEAGAPKILFHNSNFRPLKRVEDVVRVFAEVRKEIPALLVLVGDGPQRASVAHLISELKLNDSVALVGEQNDFVWLLQSSDLFLLPSETESFGLAALEALSCGLPVVASRVGGVPELISDGETGLLFPVGDIKAMAAGALKLLREPALRARFSAAARADVERKWKRAPMVTRYEDYYERILARGTR